ncbi:hypothetical protein BGZ65_006715 [Modicella reniformis]|uniref:RRM domain-containing protein n=1 Tax=Modicella reniformis TaxID=1440133 RepID=A0A9P6M1Q3_9FUNG|nr:hypothetical protein BGZ65_006715 [Modicella reniformis]
MEVKLQEKFALLQQMKRDKELKDAKAKENQPIDIFALAGVSLPTAGGGVRSDQQGMRKRPQVERLSSLNQGPMATRGVNRRLSQSSTVTSPGAENERVDDTVASPTTEKKLKRSSMAARRGSQMSDYTNGSGRGRQLSISSVASSDSTPSHTLVESPITAMPPTPISPPGNEGSAKQNHSSSGNPEELSIQRKRDMIHNVRCRAGSIDENGEAVLDVYGRSVLRSRRQSSDEGSDYTESKGRERNRDFERDRRADIKDHGTETDLYVAASRYLDIAFYPTKIYVGNLPDSVSLTSLRVAFKPFGDIEDMNLVEGKDFGFVTYKEATAARSALEKMNGTLLEGATIRVNRAKIPERNRHGFAGVAWMDEDGELARMEEEQHKQAAAIAGTVLSSGSCGSDSNPPLPPSGDPLPGSPADMDLSFETHPPLCVSTSRPIHQLPVRPRSPKLPPKPAAAYPPVGTDPRAVIAARGGGRQILSYNDL